MERHTTLSQPEMRRLYQRLAPLYDASLWGYYLAGFRVMHYRHLAVRGLGLRRGDTVVDLGCGTGLNFRLLREAVGPEGRVIGVDLSAAMLKQAGVRVRRMGWQNIELIEADASKYSFPEGLSGILSTLAMVVVDEYDDVIRRGAEALCPGGRMALFGMKRPEGWPEWLVRLGAWVQRPFGVRLGYAERHPWEALRRHLHEVAFEERYFGAAYISIGEAQH